MDIMKEIGDKIAEKRKEKGWTQRKLAEMLHVSDKNVSKWECGRSVPDIFCLKRLADLFGVGIDYFTGSAETAQVIDEKAAKRTRAGKISFTLLLIAALLPLITAVIARIFLPDTIPCHYDAQGEVTRWGSSKELAIVGVSYFAIVLIAAVASYVGLVRINNPDVGAKTVWSAFAVFFAMAFVFTAIEISIVVRDGVLALEAGYTVREESKFNELFLTVICVVYAVCGAVCVSVPQNAVIGVRTPYAFSGKEEWEFVNAVAGLTLYAVSVVFVTVTGALDYPLTMGFTVAATLVPAVAVIIAAFVATVAHKKIGTREKGRE